MSLRAILSFLGELVILSVHTKRKPDAGSPTSVLNDKGRSHQRPQAPSLKGMEFRAETVYSRTAYANTGILEARLWLGDRDRAVLAIASFIIHKRVGRTAEDLRGQNRY